MLIAAADERGIDLRRSYMVGDRWRDVGAGKAAGCFTVFVDRGYGEVLRDRPDAVCKGLAEAAEIILSRDRQALAGGVR
jgi:D-glycero-D-manno-heptose 1,7-bisphosphate phosphatase